jgi:hypothetical protein
MLYSNVSKNSYSDTFENPKKIVSKKSNAIFSTYVQEKLNYLMIIY